MACVRVATPKALEALLPKVTFFNTAACPYPNIPLPSGPCIVSTYIPNDEYAVISNRDEESVPSSIFAVNPKMPLDIWFGFNANTISSNVAGFGTFVYGIIGIDSLIILSYSSKVINPLA